MGVNVNVIGRLGGDAEVVNGKNGQFVSFSLATDEFKNGEKGTAWLRVAYHGERAIKVAEYLKKGKMVNVIGSETVSIYTDKGGNAQVSRDVSASAIDFVSIGSGQTQNNTAETASTPEPTTGTLKRETVAAATAAAESTSKDPVDDLPF